MTTSFDHLTEANRGAGVHGSLADRAAAQAGTRPPPHQLLGYRQPYSRPGLPADFFRADGLALEGSELSLSADVTGHASSNSPAPAAGQFLP